MKIIPVMLAAALCAASQAHAQAGKLSDVDKDFLIKDRRGAAYELDSARLAVSRASRSDVKSYAEKLVHDHDAYNAALEKLGKDEGVTLPTDLEASDKARLASMEKLNGPAFDAAYIKEAIRINAEDKSAAEKERNQTGSSAIRDFIGRFAAMDAEHEKLARQLEKE